MIVTSCWLAEPQKKRKEIEMFKCKECKKTVPPHQPENHIVTERRDRTYENPVYKNGKPGSKVQFTQGTETVKEIRVCPKCFAKITGNAPIKAIPQKTQVVTKSSFKDERPRKKWKNPRPEKDSKKKKPVVEYVR